jgi:hypothetical protein
MQTTKQDRREFVRFLGTAGALSFAGGRAKAQGRALIPVKVKKKPGNPWVLYHARTIDNLAGFVPGSRTIARSKYGGRADKRLGATGFFRTANVDGRWWLVDPEGFLFTNAGVNAVRPGNGVTFGSSRANREAMQEKYGSLERWAEGAVALLREHGFNGTGGFSAADLLRGVSNRLPYTVSLSFMNRFQDHHRKLTGARGPGYPKKCMPVFDPGFEPYCDEYAESVVAYRDDPYLLGYFSDNELAAPEDLLDVYLALDSSEPGTAASREVARSWLLKRKGPGKPGAGVLTDEDRDAFRELALSRYYEITTRAIRKYDSNHLCLGSRLLTDQLGSRGIMSAAARYLDVISVNVYWRWQLPSEWTDLWRRVAAKPVLVTEFYAKGEDAGRKYGLKNQTGAGWIVPTQRDRALFYQHFALAVMECRQCVGWHWFKYMDNDPEDTTTDASNRDSNKGIVTIRYEPYAEMLEAMGALNREIYPLIDYFDRQIRPQVSGEMVRRGICCG